MSRTANAFQFVANLSTQLPIYRSRYVRL